MSGSFMYMAAIMGQFARRALAWEVSITLTRAIAWRRRRRRALVGRKSSTATKDPQLTSQAFAEPREATGTRTSVDRCGRSFDNMVVELLWRTLRYEQV